MHDTVGVRIGDGLSDLEEDREQAMPIVLAVAW